MSGSSGSQKVTTNTKLPAWYETEAKDAIGQANAAADYIAHPYMGNNVAAMDPWTTQAINATGQNMGSTNAAYGQAGQTAANVAGYTPQNFLSGNISAYMNPYTQNVENAALDNMGRAYQQNLNAIGDQAIGAHAFGGSRHGVAEGVAAAENARQMGDLSAQLRSQGYSDAAGRWQQDQTNAYNAQGLNLQGAQAQGSLAGQGQNAYLQGLQAAMSGGQMNQQQQQAYLQQQADQYNAMRQVPLEQLNYMLSALGGTQVPTSSTTKTPTSGSWLGGAAGGALAGASAGAAFGPWGAGIGGILGGIGGGFAGA